MIEELEGHRRTVVDHVAYLVAAYVSNNHVAPNDLPALIASIRATIAEMMDIRPMPAAKSVTRTVAEIRNSITPDALISFIDGKPYQMLKRHLTIHGFTPDGYREHYGLPADYPVVAPTYSARRSDIARSREHWTRKQP